MAIAMVTLLLFLDLIRICSSNSVLDSTVCGDDLLAYQSSSSHGIHYINGNQVGKSLFCEALQFHYTNGCNFHNYLGIQYCGLDLSLAEPSLIGGRKLLQTQVRSESPANVKDHRSMFTNKKVGFLVPGVFVLCCVAICPCFYPKRKENANAVLTNDLTSTNSFSTFDVNAVPEKFPIHEKESVHDKIPQSPLRVPPSPSRFSASPRVGGLGPVNLTLNQIMKATRNFSPLMQIGEGGFGTVYKAQIENGMWVAIKRAKKEHFESLQTEFSNEVDLLAKIDHQNLVKLLGYIDKGNERLIITEYVPNGTLREHLDGLRGKILDFTQRLAIAIDVAHGLTYLHLYAEKQIIHRDVKSSNILLTDSMRAKVADFGFARLGSMDADKTHVSTKVKGTVGYLDPEYMKTYQLTPKSDVYSFGILLVEILSGRRPVELRRPPEERVTLRWAFLKFNEGCVVDLLDPRMEEAVDAEILLRIFNLAFECAAPIRSNRPDMKIVGEQLWGIRADYLKSLGRG